MKIRAVSVRVAGAAAVIFAGAAAACVLADPPAALPVTPILPPEIVRDSVQPPIAYPLLYELPPQFSVPVEADPRETQLDSQFVIDQAVFGNRRPLNIEDGGAIVLVDVPTEVAALNPNECHTIEIRVSYPVSSGSDSVLWFYGPGGSFTNCPVFDAGPSEAGGDGD